LFVGESATLVTDRGGAVRLQPNGSDLFYFRSAVNPALGAEVYSVVGIGAPTDAVVTPAGANGSNNHSIVYARDVSFEAHSVDSVSAAHLYIGDLTTQTYRKISNAPPAGEVYPRFTDPDVSPDSRYVAFRGMLPGAPIPGGGGVFPDTFDVFVYDTQGVSRTNVTKTHTNHRNAFPTWSTDHRWLTFISDRTANQWELYGLPVTGGLVNTSQASLVRLTNTGGSITDGTIAALEKPLMAWNPVSSILAVVGVDAFYLVQTTPTGASQIDVPITAAPIELQWSPDGSLLAVSVGGEVLTIETDGSSTKRVDGGPDGPRPGDTFADLAWTPDGQWLLYRATRGSSSWLEAYDIDQSLLSVPIAITSAEPHSVGNRSLGEYRSVMSMSPAVGNANVLFYPTFAGAGTVGVKRVDASALSP
jgi:Tol biopolymer transport system component